MRISFFSLLSYIIVNFPLGLVGQKQNISIRLLALSIYDIINVAAGEGGPVIANVFIF